MVINTHDFSIYSDILNLKVYCSNDDGIFYFCIFKAYKKHNKGIQSSIPGSDVNDASKDSFFSPKFTIHPILVNLSYRFPSC